MPKVARNVFNIGDVWNPACCHGNKTVYLKWPPSTFSRILLKRIKHFWFKLAEISFPIIFHQTLVECMTSSLDYFAYFKNLNISGTKKEMKIVNSIIFLFSCRLLAYVLKGLKRCGCDFPHSSTLRKHDCPLECSPTTTTFITYNKQLLDEVEHDIMNYQNRGHQGLIIHDIMRKPNSTIVLLYIF